MKIRKYDSFITETINLDEYYEKLDEKFVDLKKDILQYINDTLEENNEIKHVNDSHLEEFIKEYVTSGKDSDMIDNLIEDNDIFNFYLKHQSDIDELLNDSGYMTDSPNQNNVYSLYDVVIDGTKESIFSVIKEFEDSLF